MSKIKKIHSKILEKAASLLQNGDVVAVPTETVYGLAANIHNYEGIKKIFSLKKRPHDHPLIVHCCDIEMAQKYAVFSKVALQLATNFWPGPLTLILPKTPQTPLEVTGGRESVGIRIPQNDLTIEIIRKLGSPIVAPSANLFGKVSPTKAKHVLEDFKEDVFVVDGGDCSIGLESTILDLFRGPAILRPGKITASDILIYTKHLTLSETIAPGTLVSHYQPNTPVLLSHSPDELAKNLEHEGYKVVILPQISPQQDAQKLYHSLRELDKKGFDYIIAKLSTIDGIGIAINDRLQKAAHKINN
jgi:L-threonylcarbamoyladenylate synthase